jgi:hypothetical protein
MITVIEGKPNIGERLLTDWSMGAPVEVGAGWIHGPEEINESWYNALQRLNNNLEDDNTQSLREALSKELSDEILNGRCWPIPSFH